MISYLKQLGLLFFQISFSSLKYIPSLRCLGRLYHIPKFKNIVGILLKGYSILHHFSIIMIVLNSIEFLPKPNQEHFFAFIRFFHLYKKATIESPCYLHKKEFIYIFFYSFPNWLLFFQLYTNQPIVSLIRSFCLRKAGGSITKLLDIT